MGWRFPAPPRQRRGDPVPGRQLRPRDQRVRRRPVVRSVRVDPGGRAPPSARGRADLPDERHARDAVRARDRCGGTGHAAPPAALLRHAPPAVAGRIGGRVPPRLRRLDPRPARERFRGDRPRRAAARARRDHELPVDEPRLGAPHGRPRRSGRRGGWTDERVRRLCRRGARRASRSTATRAPTASADRPRPDSPACPTSSTC